MFENFFVKSAKPEAVQKKAEKIRYPRRDDQMHLWMTPQ